MRFDEVPAAALEAAEAGGLEGAVAGIAANGDVEVAAGGLATGGRPMRPDTVFWLASMTKPVTSLAAMQLVEQGRVGLDEPIGRLVPYLDAVQVLEGFDDAGDPILRPPRRPVTLRHLLAHTAGFGYDFTDGRVGAFAARRALPNRFEGRRRAYELPLLFDPGEAWTYGVSTDWVGQVIEALTGSRLDAHLEGAVLGPLRMHDTGFRGDAGRERRTATIYRRGPDGLVPTTFGLLEEPEFFSGGSGLYGTVPDYLRFVRMVLNRGELDGVRLVAPATLAAMGAAEAVGPDVGGWVSANPASSNDAEFLPGAPRHFGLGFLVNEEQTPEGRSAGSLAWAGLANTYFWVDPAAGVGGVFATQVLPFFDPAAVDAFRALERAAYTAG